MSQQRTFRLTLSGGELKLLQRAAETRGMHADELFDRLVLTCIHENLFDAVLDDKMPGLPVIAAE